MSYLELGPTPCDEPCAQVGSPNYTSHAEPKAPDISTCYAKPSETNPKGRGLRSNPSPTTSAPAV